MTELDHSRTVFFAQPILHVVRHRLRHEKRSAEFKQCGTLDGLYSAPAVAVALAKVAEPPPAGPRLELHRHRCAVGHFIPRPKLFQQCFKRDLERSIHADFLVHSQGEAIDFRKSRRHYFSFEVESDSWLRFIFASARSFTRFS